MAGHIASFDPAAMLEPRARIKTGMPRNRSPSTTPYVDTSRLVESFPAQQLAQRAFQESVNRSDPSQKRGRPSVGLRGSSRFNAAERTRDLVTASSTRRHRRIMHDDEADKVMEERSQGAQGLYAPPTMRWLETREQRQRLPTSWAPRLFESTLEQRQVPLERESSLLTTCWSEPTLSS